MISRWHWIEIKPSGWWAETPKQFHFLNTGLRLQTNVGSAGGWGSVIKEHFRFEFLHIWKSHVICLSNWIRGLLDKKKRIILRISFVSLSGSFYFAWFLCHSGENVFWNIYLRGCQSVKLLCCDDCDKTAQRLFWQNDRTDCWKEDTKCSKQNIWKCTRSGDRGWQQGQEFELKVFYYLDCCIVPVLQ